MTHKEKTAIYNKAQTLINKARELVATHPGVSPQMQRSLNRFADTLRDIAESFHKGDI